MSSQKIDEIMNLYNQVFDENGNIKLCGRETCKQLMLALNEIFKTVKFGDMDSGFLYIDVVKEYINRLIE